MAQKDKECRISRYVPKESVVWIVLVVLEKSLNDDTNLKCSKVTQLVLPFSMCSLVAP